MYPDLQDVSQTMHRLTGVTRPVAEDIWPAVVLTREFLSSAYQWCRNYGRHKYVPASELLQRAEKFIGKKVTPYQFCLTLFMALPAGVAANRIPYSTPINVNDFGGLKIKFPPLDRIEEMREPWRERQLIHETEIEREREAMAQRKQWLEQTNIPRQKVSQQQ